MTSGITCRSAAHSGRSPAETLQTGGPEALQTILRDQVQPLSAVVIDAHLAPWERRLQDAEGPLLAMRSTAAVIAGLLPAGTAETIRQITGSRELATVDEQMRPVANPELPEIARVLPADAAYQTMRVAERLGFTDYSDVLAEVANAVTRGAARPGSRAVRGAPQLAASSFPHPPTTIRHGDEHAATPAASSRQPPDARSRIIPIPPMNPAPSWSAPPGVIVRPGRLMRGCRRADSRPARRTPALL